MVLGFTEKWRGFPTHFVEHVETGRKWHSIRAGERWRVGMVIHMATGVRTKGYRCFRTSEVVGVQRIKIVPSPLAEGIPRVLVERGEQRVLRRLEAWQVFALAINDGFDTCYAFNAWFRDACRDAKSTAFRGQIVMWTKNEPY